MRQPSYDETGTYPSDETLEAIERWPFADRIAGFAFALRAWNQDYGVIRDRFISDQQQSKYLSPGHYVELVTGGWSGNESIVSAMRKNLAIWQAWEGNFAGGLWIFNDIRFQQAEKGPVVSHPAVPDATGHADGDVVVAFQEDQETLRIQAQASGEDYSDEARLERQAEEIAGKEFRIQTLEKLLGRAREESRNLAAYLDKETEALRGEISNLNSVLDDKERQIVQLNQSLQHERHLAEKGVDAKNCTINALQRQLDVARETLRIFRRDVLAAIEE